MASQKDVLKAFKDNKEILRKKDIIDRTGVWYYANADKHFGDILGRMVKNGSLIRVSVGKYKLGTITKPSKVQFVDPDQTDLFD